MSNNEAHDELAELLHQTGEHRFCECLNHIRNYIPGPKQTEAVSQHMRFVLSEQRRLMNNVIALILEDGEEDDAEWILRMLFIDPDDRETLTASYLQEAGVTGEELYIHTIMMILDIMVDAHLFAKKVYDSLAKTNEKNDED